MNNKMNKNKKKVYFLLLEYINKIYRNNLNYKLKNYK